MFKRIFILCLIATVTHPFISKTSLFAHNKFSSLQCDTVIESPQMGKTQGKFYIKGNKVRMEADSPDEAGISMVTLYDGKTAYIYFPAQNMAMVTPASQVEQQLPVSKDSAELNKKIIGQETVDGRLCDIYEFNDRKGGTYKVWVAKDIDFPVKSEAGGMKTYYKNIRTNVILADSLFTLPQGVNVQGMGDLMQQTGNPR